MLMATAFFSISTERWGRTASIFWSKTRKRLVEKGTPMAELMLANPADLDTGFLETTPIQEFDVMGQTNFPVNIKSWRLSIDGAVQNPTEYTYEELLGLPILELNVLLICPGFFAYNGKWKGFSVVQLLEEAGVDPEATHVKFKGSQGFQRKSRRFGIDEVRSNQLFLAYGVNGISLPKRHGFPLRLVAEGHKGRRWVKYVDTVTVVA
jgi:DMSO/TMAO reductase YedYZ molybdopterin-dependent catalytic subunit